MQVKQLHGLLPICSYCKSIRRDDNYWQQVEHYIAAHSDAQFSHGICPGCYDKVDRAADSPRSANKVERAATPAEPAPADPLEETAPRCRLSSAPTGPRPLPLARIRPRPRPGRRDARLRPARLVAHPRRGLGPALGRPTATGSCASRTGSSAPDADGRVRPADALPGRPHQHGQHVRPGAGQLPHPRAPRGRRHGRRLQGRAHRDAPLRRDQGVADGPRRRPAPRGALLRRDARHRPAAPPEHRRRHGRRPRLQPRPRRAGAVVPGHGVRPRRDAGRARPQPRADERRCGRATWPTRSPAPWPRRTSCTSSTATSSRSTSSSRPRSRPSCSTSACRATSRPA